MAKTGLLCTTCALLMLTSEEAGVHLDETNHIDVQICKQTKYAPSVP